MGDAAGAVIVGPGPGATGGAADGFGGAVCDGTAPLAGPTAGAPAAGSPTFPGDGAIALGAAWSSGRRAGDPAGGGGSDVVPGALAGSGPVARSGREAPSGTAARSGPAARSGRAVSPGSTASALVGGGTEPSIDWPDPVVGAAIGAGSRSGLVVTSGGSTP